MCVADLDILWINFGTGQGRKETFEDTVEDDAVAVTEEGDFLVGTVTYQK